MKFSRFTLKVDMAMGQDWPFLGLLTLILLIALSCRQCQAYLKSASALCPGNGPDGFFLEPYDKYTQICCAGKVQNREKGRLCCGKKELYFRKDSICCNGTVTPRKEKKQFCCGKNLIYTDEAFCCENNPVPLTETQKKSTIYLSCCGNNKVIDLNKQFCCDKKPRDKDGFHSCCKTEVFDIKINKCMLGRVIPRDKELCGNSLYSPLTSSCCGGVVHDKIPEKDPSRLRELNPHFGCCGTILMNVTSEKCCLEKFTRYKTHTIPSEQNIRCCGEGFYNTSSQVCIHGMPQDKKENHIICGQDYIDLNEKQCCENILPYNPFNQECCPGHAPCIIAKGKVCCNGYQMDESMEVCCGSRPCKKRNKSDDQCCYSPYNKTYETFNSKENEFCINGTVRKMPEGYKPCGNSGNFDPKTEFCCDKHVYSYKEFSACCFDEPYNKEKKLCCHGYLSELSPKEGRCCGTRAFSLDDDKNPCMAVCPKKGSKRGKLYDTNSELCCDGRIYGKAQDMKCCGRKLINTVHKNCCADRIPFKLKGHRYCCNDAEVYHNRRQKCVNGKVEPRLKQTDTERLCKTKMIKHFDFALQHACFREYGITGKISNVKKVRHGLQLELRNVKGLKRMEGLKRWRGSKILTFYIHVTSTCRKSYLPLGLNVIIFFDTESSLRDGNKVALSRTSKFTITKMTNFRLRRVTRDLSRDYCQKLS